MTKIEIIEELGNRITELDILAGSLDNPDSAEALKLRKQRGRCDWRQRKLVRKIIDENDANYQTISVEINRQNEKLKQTIKEIEKIVETIASVKKLISAIDKLLDL